MKKLICLILSISVSACASTTVINSEPEGATVYLNGEKAGITPYTHTDTHVIFYTNAVLLKKEGYQDFSAEFSRDENVNVGALIGGILVGIPYAWVLDYKPNHSYEMVPLKDAVSQ